MGRRELTVWIFATVTVTLAVCWLVERQHIAAFRAQLDAWGKENQPT